MGAPGKQCAHGVPPIAPDEKEDYSLGLKDLLKRVTQYLEKGSNNVGKKAAEKWKKDWPQLITQQFLELLAATGTRMLLTGDDRARFVVQAFAEAIGVLEKQVKGSNNVKEELRTTLDEKTGVEKATRASLEKFYRARIPCKCLNEEKKKVVEKPKEEELFGVCSFAGCGEKKPLSRLSACAGCQVNTYCCVDCQRNDWPEHSKVCQRLALERQQQEAADLSDEEEEEEEDDYSDDDEDGSSEFDDSEYDSEFDDSDYDSEFDESDPDDFGDSDEEEEAKKKKKEKKKKDKDSKSKKGEKSSKKDKEKEKSSKSKKDKSSKSEKSGKTEKKKKDKDKEKKKSKNKAARV